jgi:thiol:disulfide interchange protein DsbD
MRGYQWIAIMMAGWLGAGGWVWGAERATQVRLVLPVETVVPGERFLAGIEMTMKPGWHTYWRNGGDSGAPTTLNWQLPEGLSAGEILWPAPEVYEEVGLITYVLHGTVMLLVPITVAEDAVAGVKEVAAGVRWLECEKLCVPGRGSVSGTLTVGGESRASTEAGRMEEAYRRLPKAVPAEAVSASWEAGDTESTRTLRIEWRPEMASGVAGTPDFFPSVSKEVLVGTATEREQVGGGYRLGKTVEKLGEDWPGTVEGLLVLLDGRGRPVMAQEARLEVGGAVVAEASVSVPVLGDRGGSTGAGVVRGSVLSLPAALGLALVGGLLLNIMPCVLPVIALKILGFVRQAGQDPREIRKLGWVYGLGVWVSFMMLAGVVLAVKRAAGVAGWGMQFGNPIFLVALTTLILVVALTLFGVFEFNLTGRALDQAGQLTQREGSVGTFFHGMLAVALATPCTAPFLAPALGYAFVADATTILLVFTAVAVGLALPYVVLSWQPAWVRHLPKPGLWMEHFKVAMGFPMLGTAIWLYTLTTPHFGEAGPLWLGLFLAGVALSAWIWGAFVQRGRRRQGWGMVVALLVAGTAYGVALEGELKWRERRDPAETEAARRGTSGEVVDGIEWQPWTPEAVVRGREERRVVFVEFTANWCLTCKANHRTSINIPEVRERFAALDVVALKGDHTFLPRDITLELQKFGRAGVPLVVVYPRDPAGEPVVLPEILTPGMVLAALEEAAR